MARMIDADRLLLELTALSHGQVWPGWTYDGIRLLIERQPTLTPPAEDNNVPTNEPLTLDDLRKIDTVTPLWVHNLSWGQHKPRLMLVRHVTSNYWSCVDFDGFETIKSDDYGSRYLIYRRPPEGEL